MENSIFLSFVCYQKQINKLKASLLTSYLSPDFCAIICRQIVQQIDVIGFYEKTLGFLWEYHLLLFSVMKTFWSSLSIAPYGLLWVEDHQVFCVEVVLFSMRGMLSLFYNENDICTSMWGWSSHYSGINFWSSLVRRLPGLLLLYIRENLFPFFNISVQSWNKESIFLR